MENSAQTLSGKIKLTAEGEWLHEGQPITHERTIEMFFKNIYVEDEQFFLRGEKVPVAVDVEDTAYFVRELLDAELPWRIRLSDGSEEILDLTSLDSGRDHVLYCQVKNSTARARFLRPVYYQITKNLVEKSNYFGIVVSGIFYPLRGQESAAPSSSQIEMKQPKSIDARPSSVEKPKKTAVKNKTKKTKKPQQKKKIKKVTKKAVVKKTKKKVAPARSKNKVRKKAARSLVKKAKKSLKKQNKKVQKKAPPRKKLKKRK